MLWRKPDEDAVFTWSSNLQSEIFYLISPCLQGKAIFVQDKVSASLWVWIFLKMFLSRFKLFFSSNGGKHLLLLLFYMEVLPNFALPSAYTVKIVQLMPMCIKWMYVVWVVLSALVSFKLFSAMVQWFCLGRAERGDSLHLFFYR